MSDNLDDGDPSNQVRKEKIRPWVEAGVKAKRNVGRLRERRRNTAARFKNP